MRGDETLQALIPKLDDLCDENGVLGALERIEDFVQTYERWQHEQSEHYS